jgi:hypothetical protein
MEDEPGSNDKFLPPPPPPPALNESINPPIPETGEDTEFPDEDIMGGGVV